MVNSPNNVPINLSFSVDGKINAKVVNIIMGTYEIKNNNLTIFPGGTTMMMGAKEEMEAEQFFIQKLIEIKSYKMNADKLELITENGDKLVFEPTAETKE